VSLCSCVKSISLLRELMLIMFDWHRSNANASAIALLGIVADDILAVQKTLL
jgi:hypothetical protein